MGYYQFYLTYNIDIQDLYYVHSNLYMSFRVRYLYKIELKILNKSS